MNSSNHWLIRIRDGKNFRNSNFPLWGVKRGPNGCIKSLIKNRMNPGDILWFMTSKKFGGQLIGMAEYIASYDRADESLISINKVLTHACTLQRTLHLSVFNIYF